MQDQSGIEHAFGSTTFGWKYVKVSRPAEGQRAARSAIRPFRRLPRWPERRPLAATFKYRGGSECWIEVHSRGAVARFPGSTSLIDVYRAMANS